MKRSSRARDAALVIVALAFRGLVPARAAGAQVSRDSVAATAADPRAAQPERPTVATHAYAVAPGYVEVEAGVQDARPLGVAQWIAPVVVKVGIARRLQGELQGGFARNEAPPGEGTASAGATDLAVAMKGQLLEAAPLLHDFSVQGAVKFASGASNIGSGSTDFSLLLISSRPIGRAELDLNAGYTWRRRTNDRIAPSATLLTASLGGPVHRALGAVVELFAFPGTGGVAGTAPMVGLLAGPTFQLQPSLVLDAGVTFNVRNMGANAAWAGITWNLGRLAR